MEIQIRICIGYTIGVLFRIAIVPVCSELHCTRLYSTLFKTGSCGLFVGLKVGILEPSSHNMYDQKGITNWSLYKVVLSFNVTCL